MYQVFDFTTLSDAPLNQIYGLARVDEHNTHLTRVDIQIVFAETQHI